MNLNVIIFGASGMVGEGVLIETLADPSVASVLVVGRRSCNWTHPKLTELLHGDMFDLALIEPRLHGYNACFFCLGVSSVGMNETDYRRTTYDLTMHVASTLVRLNPDMTFCYVSGTGTDSTERGRLMWARVKGKTENDLARLPFRDVYLFRPGAILPVPGQKNIKRVYRMFLWLVPLIRALFPGSSCTLRAIARAMMRVAREGNPVRTLENRDIMTVGAG